MSIDCPNCDKPLPPMRLNVGELAQVLGESRWTASALLKRFAIPWQPKGRKHKTVLLQDVVEWIRKNTAHNPEELKALLDGRTREGKSRKAIA